METESPLQTVEADTASLNYIGQWRGLVSTTNWEKGRIISEWRAALRDQGAEPQQWSDDAWSRRVGQVTGQHVGRLRRVYERFGAVRSDYRGLYWSHFQAAFDWPDAEMWLEGAVQNEWSISEMRARRWETADAVAADRLRDAELIEAELDEDVDPAFEAGLSRVRDPSDDGANVDPAGDGESDDSDPLGGVQQGVPFDAAAADYPVDAPGAPVRPFANLAELPDDLAEAFEAYKLAILRHKLAGWLEISRDDVLGTLDALKQLATTPTFLAG
ncbi:MAG TPA: hypothetical protein VMV69_07030 [Pirellulales bacterium]|nr:hypothetical protein [Pirellulales bacterium]